MDKRVQQLVLKLDALEAGVIRAIEFGARNNPFFCYFRIRVIGTPAGRQFGLKWLYNSMEGSGQYFPLDAKEELKAEIWQRVARIESDWPAAGSYSIRVRIEEMRKKRPQLEFFAV